MLCIPKAFEPLDCLYYWTFSLILLNLLSLSGIAFLYLSWKRMEVCLVGDYRKLNEVTVSILFVILYTEEIGAKHCKLKNFPSWI